MVSLSQESIEQIRDNLNSVADTINEQIDNNIQDTEKEQEKKEETVKENVVEKDKSSLTSSEKKRFGEIAKVFIDQWMKSIEKIQRAQEKRNALAIKKPKGKGIWDKIKDWFKKEPKKVENKECKEGMKWWTKLLLILGSLGLIYYLFKDHIDKFLPMVGDALSSIGGWILDMAGKALSAAWNWVSKLCGDLWKWITSKLNLEAIGNWLAGVWKSFSDWISKLWENIKSGFRSFIDTILGLPGRLLSWVGDAFMSLIDPIIDAIKSAWDWICGKVMEFWNWIKKVISDFWDGIKGIWDNICNFFGGIWDWLTGIWDTIIDNILGIFSWDKIKGVITGALDVVGDVAGAVGDALGSAASAVGDTVSGIWNWAFGGDDEEEKKRKEEEEARKREEERKKELEKKKQAELLKKKEEDAKKALERQKEIVLKDNILETIKDICARMNVFFSAKEGGFIDLSAKVIDQFTKNFKEISKYIEKVQLKIDFKVEDEDTYKDSYDYADKSQRSIANDNRVTNYQDYTISYNIVDVPAVKRALEMIDSQQKEEVKLLTSQNDYLNKMVMNMDGLGDKLSWLDPSKLTQQAANTIVPLVASPPRPQDNYNAGALKGTQSALASMFSFI